MFQGLCALEEKYEKLKIFKRNLPLRFSLHFIISKGGARHNKCTPTLLANAPMLGQYWCTFAEYWPLYSYVAINRIAYAYMTNIGPALVANVFVNVGIHLPCRLMPP